MNCVVDCFSTIIIPFLFALAVLIVALAALNNFAFSLLSAGGAICPSDDRTRPLPPEGMTMVFELRNGCQRSHHILRGGAQYHVRIQSADGWGDGVVDAKQSLILPPGFATPWWSWRHVVTLPLLRMFTRQWFAPVARVHATGVQDYVLGAGVTTIAPQTSGELFFYVNDAVLGVPWYWNVFYRNNRGTAKIIVTPVQTFDELTF